MSCGGNLAFLSVLLLGNLLSAQLPSPRIAFLSPPGGARGSVVEVTLQGDHLEEARELRFSHPSITAAHKADRVFRVEIRGDALTGVHQCWVAGRWGASYPVSFAVDDLTELSEVEPNDEAKSAQPLPLESVVSGAIQKGADLDHYRLALKAGRRVFIECVARGLDSALDPTLRLLDPDGKSVAYNRDYQGEDALLDVTPGRDGDHLLVVKDFLHRGGADRWYRLRVSARPRVEFLVPAAVPAGTSAEVTVYGRGLPGGVAAGVHWLDGRPLETVRMAVEAPAEPGPLAARFGGDRHPQVSKVDLFDFRMSAPSGPAGPVPAGFAVGPVVVEAEPNDDPPAAQPLLVPVDFTGQLAGEYDRDWVEFEAKKGVPLWIEAIAARMGSPVDPVLTLTRADAASTFIQEVDDDGELVAGKRFDTRGIDPAFGWEAPEDGRYRIMVRDIAWGRKGLGLFYRLTIRADEQGFRLFLLGAQKEAPAALTLRRGGSDHFEVHALRRRGYQGSIRVEATGLPMGVSCPPVILGPGSSFAPLVFTAEPGAPPAAATVRVVASGWFAGERLDRQGLGYVLDRAQTDDNTVPNLVRRARALPLAVVEDSAPFTLHTGVDRIALRPGEKGPLKVTARRLAPFDGEVALTALASVPGLKAPAGKIEKGKEEATLELEVEAKTVPGRYSIALLGEADVPFSKGPKEKKNNVKVRYPAPALTLDVVAPPFNARIADAHGGKLVPGGSLAVEVAIERKHGFDGPVRLSLVFPEAVKDLLAEEERIPPGSSGGTLTVKASEGGANPGPRPDVVLRATADLFGIPVTVDLKLTLEVEPKK